MAMNIKYASNLGGSKMTDILTPTSDNIYYRTLNFQCKDLGRESTEQLTQFLDEKIELAKVVVSESKQTSTEYIEQGIKNSNGTPIRVHTELATGRVTFYEDTDKRTITELIKVS